MAVRCEFIDLIIPIENIDKVFEGGFEEFKEMESEYFGDVLWHDDYLFRTGAMNPRDIHQLIAQWEDEGLIGVIEENGVKKWKDMCVVEGMFSGPTLPCDWLSFDAENNCVYMTGKPKGEIIGRTAEYED
jgi:hypothetical protein